MSYSALISRTKLTCVLCQKQTSSPPRRQIEMNPARTWSEHWNFRATASVE